MGVVRRVLAAGLVLATLLAPAGRALAQAEPALVVRDQQLTLGFVLVDSVTLGAAGWVDIHAEAEVAGNPGPVIGYTAVAAGQTHYIPVQVDPNLVTPVLYAVLHADEGQPGVFEFPGPDAPLQHAGRAVTASFRVLDQATQPSAEPPGIEIIDQALRDGEVFVGRVVAAQPGWVDIHAEAEQAGNPGNVIGFAPVAAGETHYVRVPLDAGQTTSVLYAVLHLDAGVEGTFEFPGPDVPVQADGRAITVQFRLLEGGTAAPGAGTPGQGAGTPAAGGAVATSTPTRTPAPPILPELSPAATTAAIAQVTAAPSASPTATRLATATATRSPAPTATTTATTAPVATATPAATATAIAAFTATAAPTTGVATSGSGAGDRSATPSTLPVTGAPVGTWLLLAAVVLLVLGLALRGWRRRI